MKGRKCKMCKECLEPGKKYCTELAKAECKKGYDIVKSEKNIP